MAGALSGVASPSGDRHLVAPTDPGRRCEITLHGREQTLVAIAIDNVAVIPASA